MPILPVEHRETVHFRPGLPRPTLLLVPRTVADLVLAVVAAEEETGNEVVDEAIMTSVIATVPASGRVLRRDDTETGRSENRGFSKLIPVLEEIQETIEILVIVILAANSIGCPTSRRRPRMSRHPLLHPLRRHLDPFLIAQRRRLR